ANGWALMSTRQLTIRQIRALLMDNRFAILLLTYWTTLLFPFALLSRTLGSSKTGRDFPAAGGPPGCADYFFARTMALERTLLKRLSLPFGVALLAAATKRVVSRR